MKAVDEETLNELESAIKPSIGAIKAYLTYQGENAQYRDRAKIAVGIVSAFARVRASETNRMQVELMSERIVDEPKRLLSRAK